MLAKRLVVIGLLLGLAGSSARGQSVPWKEQAKQLAPISSIVSNDARVLASAGDSLWIGPILTLYHKSDGFQFADEEAFTEEENIIFSIAARNVSPERGLVWAGLGFDTGGGEPGAGGFLVSTDGGASFDRLKPQLDDLTDVPDSTISYGVSNLPVVPITGQAGSEPQDLAFDRQGDTVWVAGVRSGIRWTTNWTNENEQTWHRAVLPPDTKREIHPDSSYDFLVAPRLENGRGHLNHIGFSVLVDETGTVWAGTAGGVNRSRPSDRTGGDDRGWRRFTANDLNRGPSGNAIVALVEQPSPGGRNPIWMASWAQDQAGGRPQRFGVSVTPDGGDTFRRALIGERVFDLAARRQRVYAAGRAGLFVTADRGKTWRSVETFPLQNPEKTLPSNVTARSVATTNSALWVGTDEGLLRLDKNREPDLLDGRPHWRLFRTEVPVNPDEPSEQVPDVSTYAYPNPFVRSQDEFVRVVYELTEPQTVEVQIYDFGMNRVRTIRERKPAGQQETVWDGTDDRGLRVPTGAYIYTVDVGGRTVNGKILVTN